MNKTAIKNFAIWARKKLISDITYKAGLFGITENGIAEPLPESSDDLQFFDIGIGQPFKVSGKTVINQRNSLVAAIKNKNLKYKESFEKVIEEVAYTWFNRLIAVRFMEANDYLPSGVRVLSSENPAKGEPDFVTTPFETDLEFTDAEKAYVNKLKDDNKPDELFQMLFIKQCNKLHEILPELFQKTNDYTELLLNLSFTDKDGVVYHLVHNIDEDDFNVEKTGQVEIVGWLYQYYNTEPKEKVFARPSGEKIRKEDVPAATQLFTPDWIVRYMVENSLGRVVINNFKYGDCAGSENDKIESFKKKWIYFLDDAKQPPEVESELRAMEHNKYANRGLPPFVETTFLDPCMGSGHILVYAFDVFMDIYRLQGYTDQDAAQSIVRNNLYGLELDDRAAQLAYFAVMMKARYYDRRFLTRGISPNLCAIQESNLIKPKYIELFGELEPIAKKLLDNFFDAKEYGSILNLSTTADEIAGLETKYTDIINTVYDNMFDIEKQDKLRTLFAPLLKQAKIMAAKYDVVCTNPPYMGGSGMSPKLNTFVKKYYPDSKRDLLSVFIEKGNIWVVPNGYNSMVTTQSWMFLSSFEKMRKHIFATKTITNLMHMENMVMIGFGTVATIFKNSRIANYKGTYNYVTFKDLENSKPREFPNYNNRFAQISTDNFSKIPGSPIAYWISDKSLEAFNSKSLGEYGYPKQGFATGSNDTFLRLWHEVSNNKIGYNCASRDEALNSKKKWFPCNKGGSFRRWFGNNSYVANWENDGMEMTANKGSVIRNPQFYFKQGITWSSLTSGKLSMRYSPQGYVFESKGSVCFMKDSSDIYYILGLMNTEIVSSMLLILSPTLDYHEGPISRVPIILEEKNRAIIEQLVYRNIDSCKNDWDSFETSWDFKCHPLVRSCATVREAYNAWKQECTDRFNQLKTNEEELNRIFIDIYGLQDELTPEVEDKDVTVRKADLQRDIKSLISYAVGCMFGRYSLDREDLIYAGGNFNDVYLKDAVYMGDDVYMGDGVFCTAPEYRQLKTDDGVINLSFYPDYDNCIPLTDKNYFGNADIISRFEKFVKIVYGEDTLEENLNFIANAFGNNGKSSREVIRNYFLNGFFKDHCKIYQKRPIYWLFDSGKQNGFKALVYMHRWNADTIGNMRVEYLHRIQRKYEDEIKREQDMIDNSTNKRDVALAIKRKEKLHKQLKESQEYDTKVAHLALSRINIDLDDGVKVNYEKVQTAKDGKKLQILSKI